MLSPLFHHNRALHYNESVMSHTRHRLETVPLVRPVLDPLWKTLQIWRDCADEVFLELCSKNRKNLSVIGKESRLKSVSSSRILSEALWIAS